jgi:hypothetical protein
MGYRNVGERADEAETDGHTLRTVESYGTSTPTPSSTDPLGPRPVVAMIYTHSHIDHFGGGEATLIVPTIDITTTGQELTIDGVRIVFQVTPGTEAPAGMNFYFPDFHALCAAENASHTLRNILTIRGAAVRDSHAWAHYLTETIDLWGGELDGVFASHHGRRPSHLTGPDVPLPRLPGSMTEAVSTLMRAASADLRGRESDRAGSRHRPPSRRSWGVGGRPRSCAGGCGRGSRSRARTPRSRSRGSGW